MHICNQINQELCMLINEKKKILMITKNKTEKIKIVNLVRRNIFPVVFTKLVY